MARFSVPPFAVTKRCRLGRIVRRQWALMLQAFDLATDRHCCRKRKQYLKTKPSSPEAGRGTERAAPERPARSRRPGAEHTHTDGPVGAKGFGEAADHPVRGAAHTGPQG